MCANANSAVVWCASGTHSALWWMRRAMRKRRSSWSTKPLVRGHTDTHTQTRTHTDTHTQTHTHTDTHTQTHTHTDTLKYLHTLFLNMFVHSRHSLCHTHTHSHTRMHRNTFMYAHTGTHCTQETFTPI